VKNAFNYFFIGIIQGITEFLPVSSSGHIVLFGSLFELDNLLLISIVAHIGTLFAVLFCYRKRIVEIIKHPVKDKTFLNLVIATIPSIIIVLIFNTFLEDNFSAKTLIWGLLFLQFYLWLPTLKRKAQNQ